MRSRQNSRHSAGRPQRIKLLQATGRAREKLVWVRLEAAIQPNAPLSTDALLTYTTLRQTTLRHQKERRENQSIIHPLREGRLEGK